MGTTRARRVYMRDYMRVKREKLRRVAESQVVSPERLDLRPENPAAAVAAWAAAELVIPPGHPRAGDPFVIPDYGVRFLADVFDPDVREIALVIAPQKLKIGHRRRVTSGASGRTREAERVAGGRVFAQSREGV